MFGSARCGLAWTWHLHPSRRGQISSFIDHNLDRFDDTECRIEPLENPFGPKLLPMSPEWSNTLITHLPQAFVGECMGKIPISDSAQRLPFWPDP